MLPDTVIGLAAAGSAMLFQALLHLIAPDVPFAPFSLVEFAVRHAPGGLAPGAIELLGHWVLRLVSLGAILAALGAGIALRRRSPRALAFAAFLLTLAAAALDPTHPIILAVLAAALVAGVGALAAAVLLREWRSGPSEPIPCNVSRRRLLAAALWGFGVMALGGGAFWRMLHPLASPSVSADLPLDASPDPAFEAVGGLSALVTARADHYEVEVDLEPPVVSDQGWQLLVHGAVGHPLALSLSELGDMLTVERLINM
jgi:hypothetical protein